MKKLLYSSNKKTTVFRTTILKTIFLVGFFMSSLGIFGQTSIWTNPITGTNPGGSNPYTAGQTVNSLITVSGIGRTGVDNISANNVYNADAWGTTGTINTGKYYSFTLTPATGYKISLSSFVYTGTRETGGGSNAGPISFGLRSDANSNNYATNIGTPSATGTTITLTAPAYQDLSTATGFRYYAWGAGASGEYSINDFTFNGTVLGSGTTALGFGSNTYGSPTVQVFQINGSGLNPTNATITINGSADYEVSTTSSTSGFGATATLTASGGNLSGANVWVRLKATSAVGTYNQNITFGGGGITSITIPCTGTVTSAPLTISGLTADNKTYDGLTTATFSGSPTYVGLQNGENPSVLGIPSASFATANVGTGKVVSVTGYTAPNSNYTITQPSLTANITPAPLTITGVTANNKTYNGLTTATLTGTPSYVGLQNSESFSVTGTSSASFATASVGTGKTITVTGYTAPSSNYTLSQPTGLTADITTATLNITANDGSKTYGQTFAVGLGSTDFTSTGLQNGETIGSITTSSSGAINTAAVNTYSIIPSDATGGTFTPSNYIINYLDGTLTVNPAPLTITGVTSDNKTYDGLILATLSGTAAYSGLQNSETFTVTGTPSASFATANVGTTKTVTVSGYTIPSSNYTLTQPSLTADITPALLTITGVTANNKSYDGLTSATLSGTANYSGLQNGENFAVTGTPTASFSTAIAETGKSVTVTGYTAPSSNYTLSQPTGLTANITAADPTSATASVTTICIGGNTTLTLNGGGGELGAVVNWYADSCGGTFVGTGNGLSISPTITTTYFGRYEGTQYTTNCASVTITVNPLSAVGAIAGNQTICTGNSPSSNITITSATGTIQWQRADNAGFTSNVINIGTNSTTLTSVEIGTLTATKYFRAVVTSGVCPFVTSGTVTITVDSNPNVGAVSANQTICTGSNPSSNITLSSATGTIQWQSADDAGFTSGLTNIGTNSTTLTTTEIGTLTATKYFRAIVTNGVCLAVTSGTVSVIVNDLPIGPVISKNPNDLEVCTGTMLTISVTTAGTGGAISSQDEYRFSTNNGGNWSAWSTTIPSFSAVTGTNIIESRRTSTGAGCTTAAGNTVSWTVNPIPVAPIIAKNPNDIAVCSGTTLTISVSTAGTGGAISSQDEYRFSTDNGSNWSSWSTTIPNFAAVTGTNLIQSQRTSIGSGCTTAAGNTVSWAVNAVPVGPIIAKNPNATEVCSGTILTITSTAGTGGAISSQDEYRFSTDNGANWSAWSTTIPSFAAVTGTNLIQSQRTSTGSGCTTAAGNTVSWTVNALPIAPVIAKNPNDTSVCVGATLSISVTTAGTGGAISSQDEYRFSTDNGSNWSSWSTTIPNFAAVIGTNIIESRRTSTGLGCTTAAGNTVSWTVNPLPIAPVIAKNPNDVSVCVGATLSISVTTAGTGGAMTSQDEYRYNVGSGYTAWSPSIPSFTSVVGTNIIESRRTSTGSGCTISSTNTVSWTVNPDPISGTLTKTPNTIEVCEGTFVSSTATAGSGGAGTIVDELEVSLSGGAYSTYTSGASINTTGQTSVSIRTRRTATANGCNTSSYNTVTWSVNPLPTANAGLDRTIFRGNSTVIGATAVGTNTYSWVSNPSGFTSSISNPTVSPLVNTTYTLTETTTEGCAKTSSVIVSVTDNLIITKSLISIPAPSKPGDDMTYQISYRNDNNGGVAAQNVTITDILPSTAFFTYTSSFPTGTYNSGSNTLTFSIASLAAGTSGSITVSGTVGVLGGYGYDGASYYISSGSSTQTINNSANIVNAVTPTITSNVVSNSVTQNCGVSMPATLSGKIHTSTGSNVFYFIEVENTGNSTDRFTLTNNNPPPTGRILASIITNMAGDPISQTPWLTPGQKYGFLVQFSIQGTAPNLYNYTSIKATSTVCPSTSDTTYIDTYVYKGPQPTGCDLLISKSASASTVVAGANITYTLLVRNLSNNKANDLVIDDILPANLTYISATQTGADNINYTPASRLIRVTRAGNYDNGDADIVITITAQTTCSSVPSVINSATVVNTVEDNNVLNNESSVTVTVLPNVSDPAPTSDIICSGSSTTITLPSPGTNRNYKWYSAASSGTLLQTNGNTFLTPTLTSSTTYYVSQYNTLDSVCESNRTAIPITVVSAPVINSQPVDVTLCGTTASFNYNVSGTFLNQQWQVSTNGGASWIDLTNTGVYSGVTSQTLNISNMVGLYGYQYRCNLTSYSCYSITSTVASIVSLPTISGTLSVCSGSTATLTGSGIPDPSTPWTSSNLAVATVNNLGVVTGVTAGTSVITYKSSNNCTITAIITVNGLPDNTLSTGFTGGSFCLGSQASLTFDAVNTNGVPPYTLSYTDGTTNFSQNIPNNDETIFNVTATTSTVYTLKSITNNNGCVNESPTNKTANVTFRPNPTATINGTTTVCLGTTSPNITFTNPLALGITITYNINGSANQTVNVVANGFTNVSVPTTTAGSFVYNLVSANFSTNPTCSQTLSGSATVTINPLPTNPTIITTQPNCALQTGTITINSVAGETYSFDGGIYSATLVYSGLAQGSTHSISAKNSVSGCISATTSNVTITPLVINTWTTSGWSTGIPDLNTLVIIDANYNTSTNGDLNACSVTVNVGKTLTITANDYATIQNDLTVNGIVDVLDKGSLIMINDAGIVTNNGTTTVHRFTSLFEKFDYVYWSTPVASTNIPSNFPTWRTNYAFEFKPENYLDTDGDTFDDDRNDWSYASSMSPGKGYIIMTPTNKLMYPSVEEIVFSGKVNNGVITTPVAINSNTATNDDFNLVGNPYPSAISADAFINANISSNVPPYNTIGGTLYFWTHIGDISNSNGGPDGFNFSTNDYAVYTLVGGVATSSGNIVGVSPDNSNKPNGYIASGQGFFVEADNAGTLLFNNAMRVGTETNNNQFYKLQSNNKKSTNISKDRLWLNLQNTSNLFSQQLIGYFDNATLGYDKGYDGLFSNAGNYINFYSFIDNDTYKIQGRSSFDENDQVRLGYSSKTAGTFTIAIDTKEGVFTNTNQAVYLEDKVTNTIFDLKNGAYSFTTEKGTFNDRFILRYTNKTLGVNEVNKEDGILVFYSKNSKMLTIKNEWNNSTIRSIALYSISGQNISNWNVENRAQNIIQIPIKNNSIGIYIVKVKTSEGEISKKINID